MDIDPLNPVHIPSAPPPLYYTAPFPLRSPLPVNYQEPDLVFDVIEACLHKRN